VVVVVMMGVVVIVVVVVNFAVVNITEHIESFHRAVEFIS